MKWKKKITLDFSRAIDMAHQGFDIVSSWPNIGPSRRLRRCAAEISAHHATAPFFARKPYQLGSQ